MDVTLWSTNCPKCNVLKSILEQKGIKFELVEDADKMIEKGFMSAPILEVDGKVMDFITAVKWVNEGAMA